MLIDLGHAHEILEPAKTTVDAVVNFAHAAKVGAYSSLLIFV